MDLVHQEDQPVELGGCASDGYECVAKFTGGDTTYVVWHDINQIPRWILDTENAIGAKTEYRRLHAGDSAQSTWDAIKEIKKLFQRE